MHIQRQCESLANTLSCPVRGAASQREKLQTKLDRTGQQHRDDGLAAQLALARYTEIQASWLTRDIRTLTLWLSHDVLTLAGPGSGHAATAVPYGIEELVRGEPEDPRRIRRLRVALQNQRDHLLAFASVLDAKLAAIGQANAVAEPVVREACLPHRLSSTSTAYWQGWNRLRAKPGDKFHTLFDAVAEPWRKPRAVARWWRT